MGDQQIIQYGFGDDFKKVSEHNVTPRGFTGIQYPERKPTIQTPAQELGRFVREAPDNRMIVSPADMVAYLREYVFTPWHMLLTLALWSNHGYENTRRESFVPSFSRERATLNYSSLIS